MRCDSRSGDWRGGSSWLQEFHCRRVHRIMTGIIFRNLKDIKNVFYQSLPPLHVLVLCLRTREGKEFESLTGWKLKELLMMMLKLGCMRWMAWARKKCRKMTMDNDGNINRYWLSLVDVGRGIIMWLNHRIPIWMPGVVSADRNGNEKYHNTATSIIIMEEIFLLISLMNWICSILILRPSDLSFHSSSTLVTSTTAD